MPLSKDQISGLGIAFNEASLRGVEVDAERFLCGITLSVLSLPEGDTPPSDPKLQLLPYPVGRVSASLRSSLSDVPVAKAQTFALPDLLEVVRGFGRQPIYGWEFIDADEKQFESWSNNLSLDWKGVSSAMRHSISRFQEDVTNSRLLDLRVWFNEIGFRGSTGEELEISDVIAGGKRWWDGLYSGDKRTQGAGIVPGQPS